MNFPATSWRTDDTCPCCNTPLTATDDNQVVTLDCALCGWSSTWTGDHGTGVIG
jgi:hypothetical protein